jgi:hypothetical protein
MTPPAPILRIRRDDLIRTARLSANEMRVLVHLLIHACPSTGRIWEAPERIAETLGLPPTVVDDALHALAGLDFLEEHPTLWRQLRCVELGPVFLRTMFAPDNLPVEPPPV